MDPLFLARLRHIYQQKQSKYLIQKGLDLMDSAKTKDEFYNGTNTFGHGLILGVDFKVGQHTTQNLYGDWLDTMEELNESNKR